MTPLIFIKKITVMVWCVNLKTQAFYRVLESSQLRLASVYIAVVCFKFHIQAYSFDNSLSVDRLFNLQLESWLSSFNRLALFRCNNMALTCL